MRLGAALSAVADWVAGQLGYELGFANNHAAMGFGEPLHAGVVFHNWNPGAGVIELSAASSRRNWLTKARLREIFGYPFNQLECQMVYARASVHNHRVRRIWGALGAEEYTIPRLRGRDEGETILTLPVEAWRVFEGKM